MPIAAFLAGVVALCVVWLTVFIPLHHILGVEYGASSWIAKAATTPFVTAALIYVAWFVAPTRKNVAAGAALVVACAWAGLFLVSGIQVAHVPLLLMGIFGLSAGIGTYLTLVARSLRESVV